MVNQFRTFGHLRACILGDEDLNQMGIKGNPVIMELAGTGAFGEALVAELSPLFQQSFEYTVDNTHLTENTVVASGTVTQSEGMAVCATTITTGSMAMLESGHHAKYRAGQGGLARFTALFTPGVAGTEQYIGILDEPGSSAAFKNGYAVGYDGVTFGAHRFQNDALITIALEDCDDPLDGTGKSGMVIDTTKLNVFEIRFQYLGAGRIDYCIENDSNGKFIVFHSVLYANNNTVPSVYSPNFHMIMHVDNLATTEALTMKTASFGYFVEGEAGPTNLQQPQFSTGLIGLGTVTTEQAILTLRNKTTYSGKSNFIDVLMEQLVCSVEASGANNLASLRLVRGATLGGTPSYNDINTTDSVVDFDVAGTTVTGGDELMVIPLAGKNDKEIINLTDYSIFLKHGETLTISGISESSAKINAGLLFKELF